jgi:hypothetical protein
MARPYGNAPATASARLVARSGMWQNAGVFFNKKSKSQHRFYLLPGQGGKNFYRKQKIIMAWTIVVALMFGGILAAVMWWVSKSRP